MNEKDYPQIDADWGTAKRMAQSVKSEQKAVGS